MKRIMKILKEVFKLGQKSEITLFRSGGKPQVELFGIKKLVPAGNALMQRHDPAPSRQMTEF